MHDRILVRKFEFPNFSVDIDLPPLLQLSSAKSPSPFVLQLSEPKFERKGGIDALGTVRLHQPKEFAPKQHQQRAVLRGTRLGGARRIVQQREFAEEITVFQRRDRIAAAEPVT